MKSLNKLEYSVIALTLICLVFTAGYFVGKGTSVKIISFDKLAQVSAGKPVNPGAGPGTTSTDADTSLPAAEANNASSDSSPALPPGAAATPDGQTQTETGKININKASQSTLEALPGIGPVLARAIIEYRERNGGFHSTEQIMDVDGIGEKKFAEMKDMITVGKG
ncbi:MAG: ComEA family DNA-binding protein [Clostridiales bacterium]|nr:ComEA family DNA-binding protein [Clostridiales bacterium]